MKVLLSILFAFLIFYPLAFKTYVLVDFAINKEYIVNNVCVEKDAMVNTCQGSCHLKKSLSAVDAEKHQKDNDSKKLPTLLELIFVLMNENSLNTIPNNVSVLYTSVIEDMFNQFEPPVFIPPPQFC